MGMRRRPLTDFGAPTKSSAIFIGPLFSLLDPYAIIVEVDAAKIVVLWVINFNHAKLAYSQSGLACGQHNQSHDGWEWRRKFSGWYDSRQLLD